MPKRITRTRRSQTTKKPTVIAKAKLSKKQTISKQPVKKFTKFWKKATHNKFIKNFKKALTLKTPKIKEVLKRNNQSMTGKKEILLGKVATGMTFGQIPRCINCGGGRPKFDHLEGEFICTGYHDDDEWVSCSEITKFDKLNLVDWDMTSISSQED